MLVTINLRDDWKKKQTNVTRRDVTRRDAPWRE